MAVQLPYFDEIIERLDNQPDSSLAVAFKQNVHWGYYVEPDTADDGTAGYIEAAKEMTRQVCRAAGVADGQRVVDVGCGFGGAIAHMDATRADCRFVGLNFDARQLEVARRLVTPAPSNEVRFVAGDACALPFADRSFDVITALECIFHFPSRSRFLEEVRRVLVPGALLAITDFVLPAVFADHKDDLVAAHRSGSDFYGSNAPPITGAEYRSVAATAGIECIEDRDITAQTVPTYAAMRRLYHEARILNGVRATYELDEARKRGLLEYHLLVFRVP